MRVLSRALPGLAVAAALAATAAPASAAQRGRVFTESNAATGNAVLVFDRDAAGALRPAGSIPTGGLGTGAAGLGSQGAVALSHGLLFVVDAGSDTLSTLDVRGGGARVIDRVPSGGSEPISVTVRHRVAYVLDAGGAGDISGFRVRGDGRLEPLAGSTRPLAGQGPAEVAFSPDGRTLLVTEKTTNTIDAFPVDRAGRAGAAVSSPSSGATPFGFAFDPRGRAIVSEAAGGPGGTSAVSSYALGAGSALHAISASVPDGQLAACWELVTRDGRYAYTANAASNTLSGYRIGSGGVIALLGDGGVTATTPVHPTDMAQPRRDAGQLFVLGSTAIAGYRTYGDGSLSPLGGAGAAVPATAAGLAAW
jgi:6-phosphogluconolactonase (cycloisomerase 2 family)